MRGLFASVFVFSVFVNILMLTGPLFMLQVYDRVLGSRSEETLVALFLLVGGLYTFMAILDFVRGRVLARAGARFQAKLAPQIFTNTLHEATDPKARAKPARGMSEIETLQQLTNSPALLAVCDVPWTPFFLVLIFTFHPILGWVSIIGGGILVLIAVANSLTTKSSVLQSQAQAKQAEVFAQQARSEADLIASQGMARTITSRWNTIKGAALHSGLLSADRGGLFTALTKSMRLFLQSCMLAAGAYLVLQNELTGGAMIASSILLGRALAPIEQGLSNWPLLTRSRHAFRTLKEMSSDLVERPETSGLIAPKPSLEVRNVTVFAEGRKEPILHSVSFAIAPGEVVGLIGKSGAGKSTIGRVLLGLVRPNAGEVLLGGAQIGQYGAADIGAAIGYLPQSVTLFPATIAENIARMDPDPDMKAVQEAAQTAGAHDVITRLPEGYATLLGQSDSSLSGGQVQRVGLARAFYGNPKLLILDEPNSALDADGTDAMNAAIRAHKEAGNSVILMTHRPVALSECDRLIVIDGGRVKASGPRDKVLSEILKNSDQVKRAISGVKA